VLVLELVGLIAVPLVAYYGVTRERRWLKPVLGALLAGLAVSLVAGDRPFWLLVLFAAACFGTVAFLRIASSPAWAPHFENKQWARAESFDGEPHKLLPLLRDTLLNPRSRWLSLELDVNGDLLIGAATGNETSRFRIRSGEDCRHCMLESMISSFVDGPPAEVLDEYRGDTSAGRSCVVFLALRDGQMVMRVEHAGRAPYRPALACAVHAE
jgi:hypothetical protein